MILEEMVKEMEEQDEKNAQLQEEMEDEFIRSTNSIPWTQEEEEVFTYGELKEAYKDFLKRS